MVDMVEVIEKIQKILFIIAICVVFFGIARGGINGFENAAERALNRIELTVTEKQTVDDDTCKLVFSIQNNSKMSIVSIAGTMTISDCNGELISGEAEFRGEFTTGEEKISNLTCTMENDQEAEKFLNTALEALSISFRITELRFEEGREYENYYETEGVDKVIKVCDETYLRETYAAACEYLENDSFNEAYELFLKLGGYKDSASKAVETVTRYEEKKKNDSEKAYQDAVNDYDAGNY